MRPRRNKEKKVTKEKEKRKAVPSEERLNAAL
jgi:hypothetical protein